jgi:glycosyltransferase involved in cell wall biosynthesis
MTPICLVFHDPLPPEEGSGKPWVTRAWALAETLAREDLSVVILSTAGDNPERTAALRQACRRIGVTGFSLGSLVPRPAVAIFPAIASHRIGLRLLDALDGLKPRSVVFVGHAAHAAPLVAARACGRLSFHTGVVIALDQPCRYELQIENRFPEWGRDSLAEDYLERKAVAESEALVCAEPGVMQWLREAGWQLPPATFVDDASAAELPPFWRELLALRPSVAPDPPPPRVSVCLSYYEKPAFLAEALASLNVQSVQPYEVIVVDDGSTSRDAGDALSAARKSFEPLGWKFIRQENLGPASARNLAARAASGDAVLFCDADNRFRPSMVADLGRALMKSGADCVTCAFHAFRDPPAESADDTGYVFVPIGACEELGAVENVLGDTNFIIKRNVFLGRGGFPEGNRAASEDWQFLFELVRDGGRLEALPKVLFEYRMLAAGYARRKGEVAAAEAALAPLLAAADPLWRRLWAHLAGSVRDSRLARAEASMAALKSEAAALRSAEASLRARAAASEETLRLTRQHAFNLEQLRGVLERRVQELESQCDHLTDTIHFRDEAIRSHLALIQVREEKIRAMGESFSWKATAPLRYLRRTFLDSRKIGPAHAVPPPKESGAAAPLLPRPKPEFRYSVDQPQRWTLDPRPITLVGWCYAKGPAKLDAIRAVLPDRTVSGTYGLKRNDVLASDPGNPQTEYCGWKLDLELGPADKLLDLEVRDDAGAWHKFFHTGLWIGEGKGPPALTDYDEWVRVYDNPDPEALRNQAEQAAALLRQPFLSIVMPVYDTPAEWLTSAVESVRRQTYPNWELCIADDASPSAHVRPLLERFSRHDSRIKVVFREENGHISAASNSALALASGEYVAFLDHDDELAPNALFEVAAALNAHPEADWIYSDEDKIDATGRRHDAYFKPDFLPDLFLAQNYTTHLSVYRTSLVKGAGGFREGLEGSQDWDLALRVLEATVPARILHIPRILYHWRAIPGSTALGTDEKSYALEAAQRALAGHFQRLGQSVGLHRTAGGHWRVRYPLPEPPPLVSLVIPTRNGLNLLQPCVESILGKTTYPAFELIIVDNGSDDPATQRYLGSLADGSHPLLGSGRSASVLVYDKPFNFSAMNNFAVRHAKGEVLGLLNNDLEVITPEWLDEMVSHALRPEIGCVGAMLYYPNDTIQHAGCVLGVGGVAGHAFKAWPRGSEGRFNRARLTQNYSILTGACLVVRKSVYDQAGGLDEAELAVAFNDIDFCLKVRAAGYLNLWTPFAELYHHESASRGADNTEEKATRFRREGDTMTMRWGDLLDHDPAYNPNLTLEKEDFSLAPLPRPGRSLA